MKKSILLLIMMICILAMPMNCMASELVNTSVVSEDMVLLGTGYTEDGVFYEVYGEPYTGNIGARVTIRVERTVVYVGEVFPPTTLNWSEKISGMQMTGTLYLESFFYDPDTNRTTANYYGTLSN